MNTSFMSYEYMEKDKDKKDEPLLPCIRPRDIELSHCVIVPGNKNESTSTDGHGIKTLEELHHTLTLEASR